MCSQRSFVIYTYKAIVPKDKYSLSRELFKKQKEQIEFNKKFEYLKKRIEKFV